MKSETTRSPLHWKRKLALAIGRPELANAPDEELEKLHDAHMESMMNELGSSVKAGMPPGPASIANELPPGFTNDGFAIANDKQRAVVLESLTNERVQAQGIDREVAQRQLKVLRPDLFPKPVQRGPTAEQIRARDERSNQIQSLVNERMEKGHDYTSAFRQIKGENPHLFPTSKPVKKS